MNKTTSKIKIFYEDFNGSHHITNKTLEVNLTSIFENFLDNLLTSDVIDINKKFFVFFINKSLNGEKLPVDKNSYNRIRDSILNQSSEDETFFLVSSQEKKFYHPSEVEEIYNDGKESKLLTFFNHY